MDSPSMNFEQRLGLIERLRSLSWRRVMAGAFAVLLVGYLVVTLVVNWQELLTYDWQINPPFLVASLVAYLLSLLLSASAWHSVVWSMDKGVPYRKGIKFFLESNLAKRLPGLIWYALGRLYLYEREGVAKSAISVAMVFELVALIISGVIVYLATSLGGSGTIQELWQWWLLFPLAALVFVMVWPKSLVGAVNWVLIRRGHDLIRNQATRLDLAKWSLILAGGWLSGGLFIFFLAAGVYPGLDGSHVVQVINSWTGAGLVALLILIIPLGLGLKEVTLAYLLSAIVPWPVAVLISLLGRICSIIGDCVGLLVARFL